MRRIAFSPLVIPAMMMLASTPAFGQVNYLQGRAYWSKGQYPQARPPLLTHRRAPGGRTAEVDYMLGTSGCRITGLRPWGARVLNFILYSYPLSRNGRELVGQEFQQCRSTSTMGTLSSDQRSGIANLAPGATASGKLWHSGGPSPVAAHPARLLYPFHEGELARRRVPIGDASAYGAMLKSIAPSAAKTKVIDRFGFVSLSGHNDQQLQRIADVLKGYSAFLTSEFGLPPPSQYVTVYLSPDNARLTSTATKMHHLQISPSTLGYAYPEDLSVSAMIPATQAGTLLHELFHLYLRQAYGDMPQWLDEGMASLYEVSRQSNGKWVGLPNWRGRLLQTSPDLRPSLRQVITSPWFDFDGVSGGASAGTHEARQLALARYFALYLQSKGLIDDTFRAFRDREIGAAQDPAQEAVELVERIAGPLTSVEADFWRWFGGIGSRDDNFLPDVESKALPDAGG